MPILPTHIDLAGKLIMRTDEPVDDHGTHTSGIIAGGGILNPMYTGMAPRVHLVVNDFSNIIVNSPTYVTDYNMPLTNNSYYNGAAGCPGEGEYNDAELLCGFPIAWPIQIFSMYLPPEMTVSLPVLLFHLLLPPSNQDFNRLKIFLSVGSI